LYVLIGAINTWNNLESFMFSIPMFLGSAPTSTTFINLSIASATFNYDLFTNVVASDLYVPGSTAVTLTINSNILVGGQTIGTNFPCLVVNSFTSGDTVTIINNGIITGGFGTMGFGGSAPPDESDGTPGGNGGNCLIISFPTTIVNNGIIESGGGGGGGGATNSSSSGIGGDGGDGAGTEIISGHPILEFSTGQPGNTGSTGSGSGGAGGNFGHPGIAGGTASPFSGGAGGLAGFAVVGNSLVTWTEFGTVTGPTK
jgi:hypothetical protein